MATKKKLTQKASDDDEEEEEKKTDRIKNCALEIFNYSKNILQVKMEFQAMFFFRFVCFYYFVFKELNKLLSFAL